MEEKQNKDLTTFNWDDVPGEFGDIKQEEEPQKEEKQEEEKQEETLDITEGEQGKEAGKKKEDSRETRRRKTEKY